MATYLGLDAAAPLFVKTVVVRVEVPHVVSWHGYPCHPTLGMTAGQTCITKSQDKPPGQSDGDHVYVSRSQRPRAP